MASAAPAAAATAPAATGPTTLDATQLASGQIHQLEQQVTAALAEARQQQEQMSLLKQRLALAESSREWWQWSLLGLVLLGALSLWLAWQLRRQRQYFLAGMGVEVPPPAPAALPPPGLAVFPSGPQARSRPLPDREPDEALASPAEPAAATLPASRPEPEGPRQMPPVRDFALSSGIPPRPVSVEEMLDLEQQVDFFLVLGQQQSAIDLLLSHVRETGSASAAPYFKLLEIYRETGDRESFDRTRDRFHHRFNAQVPDWQDDLEGGLGLEGYPDLLQRLQRHWLKPQRAVAEVEALLLRRADLEPLDLPAYRELLLLRALLADLPADAAESGVPPRWSDDEPTLRAAAPSAAAGNSPQELPVDLLLPLGEGPLDITAPQPHLSQRTSAQAMLAEWVFSRATTPLARPQAAAEHAASGEAAATAPATAGKLDLDLSDYAPAPREFTEPAAFTDVDMRRDSRLSDLSLQGSGADTTPRR